MKILNLYCGIGGNRKLWGDEHEITAVEFNESIAEVYKDLYPNDKVIVGDAHEYLLEHYKEFDFIWSSPPCPSHSDIRRCGVHAGQYDAIYPSMDLYQQIILLKHFAPVETKWVIENVRPYYKPLIEPSIILERHYFWSNFEIEPKKFSKENKPIISGKNGINGSSIVYGFDLKEFNISYNGGKRKVLRNLVNPEVGEYIFKQIKK
jgi:DNA (cytosine-5)-methyltransferase 1